MQSWALLVDSYRLLLSRKLFWITLVISVVAVLLYASIGFDENGFFLFFGAVHFPSGVFRAGSEWAKTMYLGIFSYVIVGFWLTWAATILALMSTAPIFNDFMAGGSIDLVLSKPLSRPWGFFVKYLGGLLFVVIQVALFAVGVFLCAGWRVGEWNWKIFWAVPLVTVFYSYLYSVMVLMTLVTRSTMASFLLTILFWLILWGVDLTERELNKMRIGSEVAAEFVEQQSRLEAGPPMQGEAVRQGKASTGRKPLSKKARRDKKEFEERAAEFAVWHRRVALVKAFLPKTKETTDLLNEWILEGEYSVDALMAGRAQRGESGRAGNGSQSRMFSQFEESQRRVMEYYRERSDGYILGTSLAFEAVVLLLACWLFCRRDF